MKRAAQGYRSQYRVYWRGLRCTRPSLMNYALEVAKRMRARGHTVTVRMIPR